MSSGQKELILFKEIRLLLKRISFETKVLKRSRSLSYPILMLHFLLATLLLPPLSYDRLCESMKSLQGCPHPEEDTRLILSQTQSAL